MKRFFLSPMATVFIFLSAAVGDDKKESAAPKPTNLDKINTAKDESDPHVSSAGTVLLYSSSEKDKPTDILFSTRASAKAAWAAGKPMTQFHGKPDFRSAFLTVDGRFPQQLFYSTNKDPENGNKGNNYDLYFLTRQFAKADFTVETALRICTERDEMHPWLTADGKSLYYSRKEKDGWKVCVSHKPAMGGQFGDPEVLDLPVGFHHPTLTPDGKTLYLQGPLEKNRWGLFRASAAAKGWNKPEPLEELNDPEAATGDLAPCLARDGSALYFASDRTGGKGGLDIWTVSITPVDKKK